MTNKEKAEDIVRKYDDNGNEIHYKNSNDYEYWREYNENGKVIKQKVLI